MRSQNTENSFSDGRGPVEQVEMATDADEHPSELLDLVDKPSLAERHSSVEDGANEKFIISNRKDHWVEKNTEYDRPPTTYVESMVHFIKANIGMGMFAMGEAYRNSGLLLGPILTVAIGLIATFSQHQLMEASDIVAKRQGLLIKPSYAQTVQYSFSVGPPISRKIARTSGHLVNGFLVLTQLGFCSVYFVSIASNLKQVIDEYFPPVDTRIYMLIIFFPIWVSTWVRSLKYLMPISLVSNLLMCSGIGITLYLCAKDGLPSSEERNLVADWRQLPLFFGTVIFCFEAINLTIPLKNEMKKPHLFSAPFGVLNIGMVVIGVLLISMGTLGYWRFGEEIKGSVTLNFSHSDLLCQILRVTLSLGILTTYALQAYVPVELIWPVIVERYGPLKRPVMMEMVFRTSIVLFTLLLAETIPRIGLFISLVGSVASSSLALIFPPLLDWAWRWEQGLSAPRHLANIAILAFGVLGCVWGTYASLQEIVASDSET